ncbi:hypothetical protein KAFR_0A01510 [Kazachstania africana CBS 2517]|uniref:Exocyst complex protein EXO70 n=1 Tax=Kazachstania africana (strain ATCC 22294 / BCRC 22015 / CBS 2517 / CECT 1963 / NBRC 1671 / NRRL Y-8276) TaxID=1071382 RepID=H2AMI9_KAZAF|nr:hypothetical protein KAFR_0A01510 [Kazachstania africana CBS 2517]CCF55589.1 hypothetical protein KAFR_0A01510 [Kazachstania africana CBS 2517]
MNGTEVTNNIAIDIDEADILVLSQGLEKSTKLAYEINKSLKKISTTSSQSSKLFTPIISRNNRLVTLQRNIESTINSVASVKDLAKEASKYEIILRKGINTIGLKQFIKVIHKLDDMLEDIKSSNEPQNSEFHGIVNHLNDLIKYSETELRLYFSAILNTIKPFDPQIHMNKKIPFPYYDDQEIVELSNILDYFYNNSKESLIQSVLVSERSDKILRCMAFLEPFSKQITTSKNAPYEKGSSGMINYTEALLGFIANEKSLIDDIYSQYPNLKESVVTTILAPLLNNYAKLFQTNLNLIEQNLDNVLFFTFEMVETLSKIFKALSFNKALQSLDSLRQCNSQVKKLTKSIFGFTLERVVKKVNQLNTIPSDNGVTEPTVDTMSRLRKFSEFKSGCISAIESLDRSDWISKYDNKNFTFNSEFLTVLKANEKGERLFSSFVSDTIDVLIFQLDKKAELILNETHTSDNRNSSTIENVIHTGSHASKDSKKQRIGFFILMNLSLVEQIIEKSELNSILGKEGHDRIEKLKKRYLEYMILDWKKLTVNLLDTIVIDTSGTKKTKDKEQIKEKFRKFNDGFEHLISKNKQYRLSDPSLMKKLRFEILALVIPLYERFYNRYKDYFKNPRKHVKYTPDELSNTINQLIK